jgi:hypothetical protein
VATRTVPTRSFPYVLAGHAMGFLGMLSKGRRSALVKELIAIGRARGFLSADGKDDVRTREIGAEIDKMGGMESMRQAHAEVAAALGPIRARELEAAWGGIGHWRR